MKTFEKEFTLQPFISGYSKTEYKNKPKGTPYYEQIIIRDGEYPIAMVHIDLFYDHRLRGELPIYDALDNGTATKVKVTFEIIDEDN